jgi:hypothetical protein
MKEVVTTPAEDLAAKWWEEDTHFRGDHTNGMVMSARDYVHTVAWCTELLPEDFTGTVPKKVAVRLLTPVAQKFLDQMAQEGGSPWGTP